MGKGYGEIEEILVESLTDKGGILIYLILIEFYIFLAEAAFNENILFGRF